MSHALAKSVELPQQLIDQTQARTVGELLEIDFPVAVGKINTKRLGSYAKKATMKLYDPIDEEPPKPHVVSDVRLTQKFYLRGRPGINKVHPAFAECAAITRALEEKLLPYRRENDPSSYRLLMEGRANPFPKDMPGFVKTPTVHADLEDSPPNGRRYIAQSETPTLFVSHADTMKILRDLGYDAVLGLEIDPNSYDLKAVQHIFLSPMMPFMILDTLDGGSQIDHPAARLQSALREALQPMEKGSLTAFSALTQHAVPANIDRGRVFFEAEAHNAPGYRYCPHQDLFDQLHDLHTFDGADDDPDDLEYAINS